MVEKTLDSPKVQKQRNPYGTSKYREDARDQPDAGDGRWKEQDEGPRRHQHFGGAAQNRGYVSEIRMFAEALASAFSEQPKWQRIIERANFLADERGMPREQFYSTALIALIEKYEDEELTRAYNQAYEGEMEEEEEEIVRHVRAYHRRRLSAE